MRTSGKPVAVVTGASRGFGLAVATALAERGWRLVIDARTEAPLRLAEAQLARSSDVAAVPGDVSALDHRQTLTAAVQKHGRLDALVNNASILGPSPRPDLNVYSINSLRRVFEVNTFAPLALIQDLADLLRTSHGVVINITSDAAAEPYPGWGGYGSSKAALNQITRILAAEEPAMGVYSFDPGDMNTRMHQEAFPGEDISDRSPPEDSVPALLQLIEGRPESGHYSASGVFTAL